MSHKLLTLQQGESIANGVLKKVKDKGYAVASELGALATKDEVAESDLASALASKINGKADQATTLSGYGITDAYTKTEVDGKIASTYRYAGSLAGTDLVAALLIEANANKVYDITSELAITDLNKDLFKNLTTGDKVKKGDNVGICLADPTYTAASGTAQEGVTYYELDEGEYIPVEIEVGESVEGYYTKDADTYLFDDMAGFIDLSGVTYHEGNGIEIDQNNTIKAKIDSTNANGLGVGVDGLKMGMATPDTYSGGTKTADGEAGAMSSADKYKLDNADVTPYTAGNGITIGDGTGGTTDHEIDLKLNTSNANGLKKTSNGLELDVATADTWGGVAATGTYVAGTVYYSDQACTTKVDTSDFVPGETSVEGYYTLQKTADGTNGSFTSAEKYKLSQLDVATDAEVATVIANLNNL